MDSLKKNINDQLERLLSQLSDLEEIKNDDSFSPEEYSELKADTLKQISEFESFLQRQAKGDLVLSQISEAQQRIEDAKSKAFGVQDLKQKFQGHEAETIREQIGQVKIEASNAKITKIQFSQQLLALLFSLEKTQTKLTAEEVALREQCKSSGASQISGGGGLIGDEQVKIITSHTKDQIDNGRTYMS